MAKHSFKGDDMHGCCLNILYSSIAALLGCTVLRPSSFCTRNAQASKRTWCMLRSALRADLRVASKAAKPRDLPRHSGVTTANPMVLRPHSFFSVCACVLQITLGGLALRASAATETFGWPGWRSISPFNVCARRQGASLLMAELDRATQSMTERPACK